jgi:hypothetical protein
MGANRSDRVIDLKKIKVSRQVVKDLLTLTTLLEVNVRNLFSVLEKHEPCAHFLAEGLNVEKVQTIRDGIEKLSNTLEVLLIDKGH